MTIKVSRVVQQLRQMLDGESVAGLRDAQLLEHFTKTRAEQAFATLVHRHGPLVLGVCQRILQSSHDAEDAFQATFLVLARRAGSIRKPESLAAWLYGIAFRLARTMKRDASKRRQREQQASPPMPPGPPDLCWRELHAVLDEELQRLPVNNRQPLLLCYFEGLTQEEAAQQLGWPRGTLKRRLERGRELLRERLTRRGLALGAVLITAIPANATLTVPLPTTLGDTTIKAAVSFAVQPAVAATVASAHVITLAEGVLRTMLAAKVKLLSTLVLVVGLGTMGAFVCAHAAQRPADKEAVAQGEILVDGAGEKPAPKRPPGDPPSQPKQAVKPVEQRGDPVVPDPKAAAVTTKRFEKLARELQMFPTGEISAGRGDRHGPLMRIIPTKWSDPWHKIQEAIATDQENVTDVIGLLKHSNPKVRTLALADLFRREDPKLLPHIAAMMQDKEKTVPEVRILRSFGGLSKNEDLLPQDFKEQTVGDVATLLVDSWLQPAGFKAQDFKSYWPARKDRKFCANWFLVRLYRAGQGSSHFDHSRAPLIRTIRKEVDALPALDRDWTLLYLAAHHHKSLSEEPGQIFATTKDLLEAGKRLGPERLVDLLQGKSISTDPDLGPSNRWTRGRDDLILWVLRHGGKLLRPEDAPTLLALEPKLRDRTAWCALAAAELQPANARKWLREAFGRYQDTGSLATESRTRLAAGLWRIVGESEIDYLADWFYTEKVNANPGSTQTGDFLEAIKSVRAPADRKLVARLVADPRLEKLDYQSLRSLVEVVNGWTKVPVVPAEQLRPNWERGSWGPETPRDLKVLAGWREKLKNSMAEWNATGKVPGE